MARYKENKLNTASNEFTAGFALAIADMLRNDAPRYSAEAAIKAAGYTLEDFKKAGIAKYDFEYLAARKDALFPAERAVKAIRTPNDLLRRHRLAFGRQDRRSGSYRSKWGIKGVTFSTLESLTTILEKLPGVISAQVEDVAPTRFNECVGAVEGEMFILRTSVKPTTIVL